MASPQSLTRKPLGEAVEEYLQGISDRVAINDMSDNTLTAYANDLRDLVALLGSETITDDVAGQDVDNAIVRFAKLPDRRKTEPEAGKVRATASIARFRQSVARFFDAAAVRGWVQVSPMLQSQIPKPKTDRDGLPLKRRSLTLPQARALVEHGPGSQRKDHPSYNSNFLRDTVIFLLLPVVGARVSELTGANIADVEANPDGTGRWTIRGKGGKTRTVPVPQATMACMDAYLAIRSDRSGSAPLVVSRNGHRLHAQDIERMLDRAYKRVLAADPANARPVTPHALRHTTATLLLADGWDVKVVSKLLGHANISTTSRYLDQLPSELEVAIASHPLTGKSTATVAMLPQLSFRSLQMIAIENHTEKLSKLNK
jgi:site-specific recombinase XerD